MQRRFLATLLVALASGLFLGASPAQAFGFDEVAEIARQQSEQPYQAPEERLPAGLSSLGYDALRDIRYRPERAIWRAEGLPFELQFFHLGGGHRTPVAVYEVDAEQARALANDTAAWDYGRNRLDTSAFGELGYAGFRVHHALNDARKDAQKDTQETTQKDTLNIPAYKDELVVFLGASYFRALGHGQQYGLSARGLAIDTVGASSGAAEEFPRFKAFWIERPQAGATTLTLHALLDSPRATGAYRFVLRPGESTQMDVQARLFLRATRDGTAPIATLGIAPLTSMFQHGENQPRSSDFRPEVHDSDGLLVAGTGAGTGAKSSAGTNAGSGGGTDIGSGSSSGAGTRAGSSSVTSDAATEWLWRPLFNPQQPLVSSFALQRLQGFGLMQRDRRFAAYEDTEARYERRPSAWVEPLGDWGPGRVELLLLPTPDETHDNVAAYWVPAALPAPGQALNLAWRLHWQGDAPTAPPHGQTVQSRRGFGWVDARTPPPAGEMQWLIDFDGPALRALPADAAVQAVVSAPLVAGRAVAQLIESRAYRHPLGGWRLQLRVQRNDPKQPVELRAFLRQTEGALTETWTALIPPETP